MNEYEVMAHLKHYIKLFIFFAVVTLFVSMSIQLSNVNAEESELNNFEALDFSGFTSQEILSLIAKLNEDEISEINLIDSNGKSHIDVDTLCNISKALPNTHIKCSFDLFGKTISSEDKRIEFDSVHIGNEGLVCLREILPYLTACNYLLIADCDIDNELLAELREDFPEKHVVWRIHTFNGTKSFLTDITLFRTVCINDGDVSQLKYCNEVKYIDVGHQRNLSDISFVEGMPNLEVLIIADTNVTDISSLKKCKNLEYLELFVTRISDLSPLSELQNLQHLNISNMPNVTDITPLYELHNLKRLRIDTGRDLECYKISREQLDTITRLLPDCDMQFGIGCCNSNGWRYDCFGKWSERYILLREQMKYDEF